MAKRSNAPAYYFVYEDVTYACRVRVKKLRRGQRPDDLRLGARLGNRATVMAYSASSARAAARARGVYCARKW